VSPRGVTARRPGNAVRRSEADDAPYPRACEPPSNAWSVLGGEAARVDCHVAIRVLNAR
jgi:hypothetical protein